MVVDASLTMAWYFDDESTPTTDELLARVAGAGAVVARALAARSCERLSVCYPAAAHRSPYRDASLLELTMLPITIDPDTDSYAWSTTLRLAERLSLTLYDAAYLELPQRRSLPLATFDRICVYRRRL
jgi:predicted nucleic acid-binding protein